MTEVEWDKPSCIPCMPICGDGGTDADLTEVISTGVDMVLRRASDGSGIGMGAASVDEATADEADWSIGDCMTTKSSCAFICICICICGVDAVDQFEEKYLMKLMFGFWIVFLVFCFCLDAPQLQLFRASRVTVGEMLPCVFFLPGYFASFNLLRGDPQRCSTPVCRCRCLRFST